MTSSAWPQSSLEGGGGLGSHLAPVAEHGQVGEGLLHPNPVFGRRLVILDAILEGQLLAGFTAHLVKV